MSEPTILTPEAIQEFETLVSVRSAERGERGPCQTDCACDVCLFHALTNSHELLRLRLALVEQERDRLRAAGAASDGSPR